MQPHNHFNCNRCGTEAYVPMANTPMHERNSPPAGWVSIKVGDDPSTPAQHLCPPCTKGLTDYLQGGSAGQAAGS